MVLPLIPLALIVTGALTGTAGAVAGGRGAYLLKQAQDEIGSATEKYEAAHTRAEQRADETNGRLRAHGRAQEAALDTVVARMADFIRRNQRQVNASLKLLVDGVEVDVHEISPADGMRAEALSLLAAVAGAGATGASAAAGATGLVTTLGVASTGTAIGTLSGAAAESAVLAWLGGGSLASGGGGVALGATALNFVTVGPALLVGGLALNVQGEKALTKAQKYAADAEIACAELEAMRVKFGAVDARLEELGSVIETLVARACRALEELESFDFDGIAHAALFQEALTLTVAVRDVASTPPVNDDGDLNDKSTAFKIKYREYVNG